MKPVRSHELRLVLVTILFLLLPGINSYFLIVPLNHVTTVGSEVTFHYRTNISNKSVTWSHVPVGKELSHNINTRGSSRHLSTSNSTSGDYNFTIRSAALDDAGHHLWTDDGGYGTTYGVELVVIETGPSCRVDMISEEVVEGDIITFECSVKYRGNLSAEATWKNKDMEQRAVAENGAQGERIYRNTITISANQSEDGLIYHFRLIFRPWRNTSTPASNVPLYNYTWTSPEVKRLFPVSDVQVSVTGTEVSMSLNETITCSASGKPEVVFCWEEFNSTSGTFGTVSWNRHLTLDRIGLQKYRCVAENVVRGQTKSISSEEILVHVSTSTLKESSTVQPRGSSDAYAPEDSSHSDSSNVDRSKVHTGQSSGDPGPGMSRETMLLITIVALGTAIVSAFIVSLYCFIMRRTASQKQQLVTPNLNIHYQHLSKDLEGQNLAVLTLIDDEKRPCKSGIYDEIYDSEKFDVYHEIYDDRIMNDDVHCKPLASSIDQAHCQQSKMATYIDLVSAQEANENVDKVIEMESSYITCQDVSGV